MTTEVKLLALFLAMVVYCKADINDDPDLMSKYLHESPYIVMTSDYHKLNPEIPVKINKIIDIRDSKEFIELQKYFLHNSKSTRKYLFINRLAKPAWTPVGSLNDSLITHFVEYCFVSIHERTKDLATIYFRDSIGSISITTLNSNLVEKAINENISKHFSSGTKHSKMFDFAIIDLSKEEEKIIFWKHRFWGFNSKNNISEYDNHEKILLTLLMKLHEERVFSKTFGAISGLYDD